MATMPETPDDAVVLREYEGAGVERYHGDFVSAIERPRVQVVARSKSYQTAEAKIAAIVQELEAMEQQVIGGVDYFSIRAVANPGFLGTDENERAELVANFEVMKGRG